MPTDNHDAGEDLFGGKPVPSTEREEPSPGYETTDVNIGGVLVFLGGLAGFLLIFFVFCFVMGKVINTAFIKEDGPETKFNRTYQSTGQSDDSRHRENLANNPALQQRELQHVTAAFPTPRLDIDDGNQATADLHAREDLLLDHYSTSPQENGLVRIPVDRAMQLIAQHGLPVVSAPAASGPTFVGDANVTITAPLTSGFARTGYELDVIEAREQKLSYGKAAAAEHAGLQKQP